MLMVLAQQLPANTVSISYCTAIICFLQSMAFVNGRVTAAKVI